jgi:hypothetical protein
VIQQLSWKQIAGTFHRHRIRHTLHDLLTILPQAEHRNDGMGVRMRWLMMVICSSLISGLSALILSIDLQALRPIMLLAAHS